MAEKKSPGALSWKDVERVACEVALQIPVPKFTAAELLRLRPGAVVRAHWEETEELPLCVNGHRVAWAVFELVNSRLAARITELD